MCVGRADDDDDGVRTSRAEHPKPKLMPALDNGII